MFRVFIVPFLPELVIEYHGRIATHSFTYSKNLWRIALLQNSKLQMKELANAGSAGVLALTACVAREDFGGKSGLPIVRAARSVRTRTSALPARGDFITFEAKLGRILFRQKHLGLFVMTRCLTGDGS
jgi:hypothetical protein